MNKVTRAGWMMALVAAAAAVAGLAQDAPPPPTEHVAADASAAGWSKGVWASAMSGNSDALADLFQRLPGELKATAGAERFRQAWQMHQDNLAKASVKRDEDRAKAQTELHEHVDANDLSKALRAAVTIQTLSDDFDLALESEDIKKVVAWAEERIAEVEQSNDWLFAQELLFYLRTLYDDTSHVEAYKSADARLNAVNRRVSLLAQYAPQRLHELRSLRAERMGEKPLDEYRPSPSNDWRKKVQGIRPDILKAALKTAAGEHIESSGWRPLLRGGLEEMLILGSTRALAESFPKLADEAAVNQWIAHVEGELQALRQTPDDKLDSWKFSGMVDDLLRVNAATIQVDREVLYREFGDGATYELDEFSEIVWPDKLPRFRQATEGAFVGVGILIQQNEAHEIVVMSPLEGTPAYFGGIKPEDVIAEVDGEPTVGWSLNDAVDRITGLANTKVVLGVKRSGVKEIVYIELKREIIKLQTVLGWYKRGLHDDGTPEWNWYADADSRIAYVKLTQFTDDTYRDLLNAWREMNEGGKPHGLILDLRHNPGGLLTSAVQISNLFVNNGLIVSGEDKNGRRPPNFPDQYANPRRTLDLDGVPVVVLINQGSASASEIVSGCLQAHNAAVIVGERSFGKGSVQTVHVSSESSRLKLTTQYYRLPPVRGEAKGRLVHKRIGATEWGVDPDIIVKMTPQQTVESLELRQQVDVIPRNEEGGLDPDPEKRPNVQRLLTEGLDPQLQTAMLILQAQALSSGDEATRRASNE